MVAFYTIKVHCALEVIGDKLMMLRYIRCCLYLHLVSLKCLLHERPCACCSYSNSAEIY